MHIFFSGIGGAGIGPLALLARDAGHRVSGSDTQQSAYLDQIVAAGVTNIALSQDGTFLAAAHAADPVDWYVYSSAVAIENPTCAEFSVCCAAGIRMTRRAELLNVLIEDSGLRLIAVAGTHGKTTTTAMIVWLFRRLGIPVSYSVGGRIPFGPMAELRTGSEYFVYEACEFDRNFLAFHPEIAAISGIDWDHPDTYPTRTAYEAAFRRFLDQSRRRVLWSADRDLLAYSGPVTVLEGRPRADLHLPGAVNRRNATLAEATVELATGVPAAELAPLVDEFPGVRRRFERIADGLYTDYAHTIGKIRGALQTADEVAHGAPVVVVYEGLHNTRQHFMRAELAEVFAGVAQLYIVPTYLARETPGLEILSPSDLRESMDRGIRARTVAAEPGAELEQALRAHLAAGKLVVGLSGGGRDSLDQWLRDNFSPPSSTSSPV